MGDGLPKLPRYLTDKFMGVIRIEFKPENDVVGAAVLATSVDGRTAGAFQFKGKNLVRYEGDYQLIGFIKQRFIKRNNHKEEWVAINEV